MWRDWLLQIRLGVLYHWLCSSNLPQAHFIADICLRIMQYRGDVSIIKSIISVLRVISVPTTFVVDDSIGSAVVF